MPRKDIAYALPFIHNLIVDAALSKVISEFNVCFIYAPLAQTRRLPLATILGSFFRSRVLRVISFSRRHISLCSILDLIL